MPIEVEVHDAFVHDSYAGFTMTGTLTVEDFTVEKNLYGENLNSRYSSSFVTAEYRLTPNKETAEQIRKIFAIDCVHPSRTVSPLNIYAGWDRHKGFKDEGYFYIHRVAPKDFRGCRGEGSKERKLDKLIGQVIRERNELDLPAILQEVTDNLIKASQEMMERYNKRVSDHLRNPDSWKWDKMEVQEVNEITEEIKELHEKIKLKKELRRKIQLQRIKEGIKKSDKLLDQLPKETVEAVMNDAEEKGLELDNSVFGSRW